jgi:hypothetical protein
MAVKRGLLYWTQNICEPRLRDSDREREDWKGKRSQDAARYRLWSFPPLPVPRLDSRNVRISNGQQSTQISCGKNTFTEVHILQGCEEYTTGSRRYSLGLRKRVYENKLGYHIMKNSSIQDT